MNLTHRFRRVVGVVVLAGSIAAATGAAQADSTVPSEPVPTEAPIQPTAEGSPPGADAGGSVTPPADGDGIAAPSTTTAPATTDPATAPDSNDPPVPPSTTPAESTETPVPPPTTTPPGKPPVTTTPPSVIAVPTTTTPTAAIATLISATVATAPQSPLAKPGNATVKLTWNAPSSNGGAAVDKYAVQRYTSNGWVNVSFPTGLGYTVGSLANGTKYSFRIRAHNAAGWSAPSSVVSAVPRTVPSAPRSPLATAQGNRSVTLSWLAPASTGGAVIGKYEVQRSTNGTTWTTIASPTSRGYTATALTAGTKYYFRVRAHNEAGFGPFSTMVNAVPYTTPSAPSQCKATQYGGGSHTLLIQWQPASSDGGSPVLFYEVTATSLNDPTLNWNGTKPTAPGFMAWWPVPYGWYEVRVRAFNAAGFGPACTAVVLLWL